MVVGLLSARGKIIVKQVYLIGQWGLELQLKLIDLIVSGQVNVGNWEMIWCVI